MRLSLRTTLVVGAVVSLAAAGGGIAAAVAGGSAPAQQVRLVTPSGAVAPDTTVPSTTSPATTTTVLAGTTTTAPAATTVPASTTTTALPPLVYSISGSCQATYDPSSNLYDVACTMSVTGSNGQTVNNGSVAVRVEAPVEPCGADAPVTNGTAIANTRCYPHQWSPEADAQYVPVCSGPYVCQGVTKVIPVYGFTAR